jgi:hypothetical protein
VNCWHRPVFKGALRLCIHCGVQIEECPCARNRVPDAECIFCDGSGWVSLVRGKVQKFRDYVAARD